MFWLIAAGFVFPVPVVPWDITIEHIARVLQYWYYFHHLFLSVDELINAELRVSAMLLKVEHFKASAHKIKAALMLSSSNIDANFARVLCLQSVESVFQT